MNDHVQRRRRFVDAPTQGALVAIATGQWCILFFTASGVLVCDQFLFSGRSHSFSEHILQVWQRYAPAFVVGATLLPFFLYQIVKLSHRFAGPVIRLRRELRRLADGEEVAELRFRDGDYWHDLAEAFNGVCSRIEQMESRLNKTESLAAEWDAVALVSEENSDSRG